MCGTFLCECDSGLEFGFELLINLLDQDSVE